MTQVALTVLALAGLLGIVSLMLPLAERLRIPHAVLLAGVGCAIGALVAGSHGSLGLAMADDVLTALREFNLTADSFLFIFLPALLFETAINVDVRRLTEEIAPVLLLAIIGVLVSTFVVGIVLWPMSGVGLIACLMLGAILATTDPVAVVAIFRDIGAPRRLSMLVEGESLLNDAAAIALFGLLAAMMTGAATASATDAAAKFVIDFLGGIAFGCVMGWLACRILAGLREHQLAESTLTVALAYFTFVVGDHYLHISGVVAVVAAGLVLSGEGRRRLLPSNWQALERTWQQIGFWASSLIFLLAAMMVPASLEGARWLHLGLLAAVIVAATAARALTLFGLLPILSAVGLAQRVSTNQKLVILWGGMRGAVSLALALAATENLALPAEVRQFIGVLATGFVLFTLFVSAPTLRPLMHWLGLDRLSPAEVALRDRVVALSLSTIQDDLGEIAGEHEIDAGVTEEAKRPYQRHIHAAAEIAEENAQIAVESRLHSALATLVEREQEFYLAYFDARAMSPRAVATLLTYTAWLRDAVKTGAVAEYREVVERTLAFSFLFRVALYLQRWVRIERPLAIELADRFEVLLAQRLVLGELHRFTQRELKTLFGSGVAETLEGEIDHRRHAVGQAIAALMLQYPSYARALQQRFLTLTAVRLEEERYRRLYGESIISAEVLNDLERGLTERRRAAEQRPPLDLGLSRAALVDRVPLFATLEEKARRKLCRLLRPRLVVPGETIVRRGERGDSMYFISSGAVEVRLPAGEPIKLGTGDFFGEIAVLMEQPRNADVVALGYCRLLILSRRDLERLFRTDQSLRERIEEVARERLRPQEAQEAV